VSANLVAKTVIDLLVTAAAKWPSAAGTPFSYYWIRTGGRDVTLKTADRVGQMLWLHNWEITEGWVERDERSVPDPPEYVWEPLAGAPDPLLVLRQISYYQYQSVGDEVEGWLLGEPSAFLRALQSHAQGLLPGMSDLPWGVGDGQRDLFLRFGGADPAEPPPPALFSDPERESLDRALAATEIPFGYTEQTVSFGSDGKPVAEGERAEWLARWEDGPIPSVGVTLHPSELSARATYDQILGGIRGYEHDFTHTVLRRGRVTVAVSRLPRGDAPQWWFDRTLAAFDDADERWARAESLRPQASARVIGTRVPLTREGERAPSVTSGGALVARDRDSLDSLRRLIDDPELADALSRIDIDQASVILLPKVGSLELSGTVELADLGRLSSEPANKLQLNIGVDDVRRSTGTLLAIEALGQDLSAVFLKNNLKLPAMRP
jgi:hypothetical protein